MSFARLAPASDLLEACHAVDILDPPSVPSTQWKCDEKI